MLENTRAPILSESFQINRYINPSLYKQLRNLLITHVFSMDEVVNPRTQSLSHDTFIGWTELQRPDLNAVSVVQLEQLG